MKRLVGSLVAAVLLTSCSSSGAGSGTADDPPEEQTLTVFAAASLKGTFTEIGKKFEAEHEGVKVVFSFAGSSDLVTQIQQGAPADVFASADTKNMDEAVTDDLVEGAPINFATNTLEIATPPGNPAKVESLNDLAKKGIKVVLCAPEVPCGSATQKVENASGVDIKPVSEESSVTDVLNKVQTGEADAGLVYVTDVKGAGNEVEGITFPASAAAVNTYPIAALSSSKHAGLAKQFATYVAGAEGRSVLAAAGFAKP